MYFQVPLDLYPTAGIAQCRQRRIVADPVNRSRGCGPGATVLEDSPMSQVVTNHGFESMGILVCHLSDFELLEISGRCWNSSPKNKHISIRRQKPR